MKPPSGPKALKQMQHVVLSNTNFAGAVQSFCELAEDRQDDGNLLHFQNPILVLFNQEW